MNSDMNSFSGRWSGSFSGDLVGGLALDLAAGPEGTLAGRAGAQVEGRLPVVFEVQGSYQNNTLELSFTEVADADGEIVTIKGLLQDDGNLVGNWTMGEQQGTFLAVRQPAQVGMPPITAAGLAPATAIYYEKSSPIPSCAVDTRVLRRIYKDLNTGSDEATRLELARSGPPGHVEQSAHAAAGAEVRALYTVTILAQGGDGEQVFSLDPNTLSESELPVPLRSIEFEVGAYYRLRRGGMNPPNRAVVHLDLKKPRAIEWSNLSLEPTPNASHVQVQVVGSESIWVAGLYGRVLSTLSQGRVRTGWIHSRYTYDLLLLLFGFPGAAAAATLLARWLAGSTPGSINIGEFAIWIVALFSLLFAFRVSFGLVRWLLPRVEHSPLSQPLHRQIRVALSAILLGLVGSLAAAAVWRAFIGL